MFKASIIFFMVMIAFAVAFPAADLPQSKQDRNPQETQQFDDADEGLSTAESANPWFPGLGLGFGLGAAKLGLGGLGLGAFGLAKGVAFAGLPFWG